MFRRRKPVRRQGTSLAGTALVGGMAYKAGKGSANASMREASQEQRLNELEQQQRATAPNAAEQQPQPSQRQQSQPNASSTYQTNSGTAGTPDRLTQLKTLGELRTSGVLTDTEFEQEKQRILQA